VPTPRPQVKPLIVPRASEAKGPVWPGVLALIGLIVVALGLLVVLTAHPGDRRYYPGGAGVAKTTIYLVENGFHSDLVMPRSALFARPHPAALAVAVATDKPWVAIGWGDASFYTQHGFSIGRMLGGLRALLLPRNHSVVHIEGLASAPERVYGQGARPIVVTDAGLERVIDRVDRSLTVESDGQPQRVQTQSEPDAAFFRSGERFSLLHLCNHWTAELLDAAGLPTTPVIDTLPGGLRMDLRMRAGVK
jgi:uncharacterized protein (TIGR02117 family)